MRQTLRVLASGLVLGMFLGDTAIAESGDPWWSFGRSPAEDSVPSGAARADHQAAGTPAGVAASEPPLVADEGEPERGWMIDSPLAKVSWPRLQFPEMAAPTIPRPWPKRSESDTPRNAWAQEPPITPEPVSPMQAVADGARRVGDRTRAAWHKTVDVLTPGGGSSKSSSRVARRDSKPSWWEKMFGPNDEPRGPQTIPEWMAQERLDP